jgi:stringent starvation protein B
MSAKAELPSRRPYLLRAMHEWMSDASLTPHLIIDANRAGVDVPTAYVKDGKIVLNASVNATQHLQLQNDWVMFDARFAGVVHHIRAPVTAILGIYARETGEGMVFNDGDPESPTPATDGANAQAAAPAASTAARRAKLTVVK